MIFTEHLGSLSIIRPSLVWNCRTELKTDIKVVEFLAKLLDIDLNCQDKQVSISTPTIIWRTPSQATTSNSTTNSTSTLTTFNALIQEQLFWQKGKIASLWDLKSLWPCYRRIISVLSRNPLLYTLLQLMDTRRWFVKQHKNWKCYPWSQFIVRK